MKYCLALSTGSSLIASLQLAAPVLAATVRYSAEGYHLNSYRSPTPDLAGHGDKGRTPVLYCCSDYWLGGNAVKRAHALDHNNLYREASQPLSRAQPLVLP
jgi:hypothetical protein